MFSKALFKQSAKANGLMWSIITFAVCFMLACVMLISGSGKIGDIATGVEDTIITNQIDVEIKKRSVNLYEINSAAMEYYDAAYLNYYTQQLTATGGNEAMAATLAQVDALKAMQTYTAQAAEKLGYAEDSDEAKEIKAVIFFTLEPSQVESQLGDVDWGEDKPVKYDTTNVTDADRANYRSDHCRTAASQFVAAVMTSDAAVEKMLVQLAEYGIDEEKYNTYGYTLASVEKLAQTSLVTYIARLDYAIEALDSTDPNYAQNVADTKSQISSELSGGFLATLPQEVSDALKEVGQMNLYNLIVGSIFYKMAGLLLPFIYVIMVANSLIAGQVDNGSMAYVLSGSAKRRQVTFTQALYLVLSVFAMTALTAATGCVCLAIVKARLPEVALTYGQLLLMNLGSFTVLFAVSGICFLASCWFNRSKNSMAIGGGITMFFLVATMLGLFGSSVLPSVVRLEALNFFNYVTIISLFDVISITEGTLTYLWKFAILFAIGIVCFVVGSWRFRKKDLPL